ncbi:hypothetical protein F511_10335 [Dorcoceras hygrometricum]|uniref:Uncharacterized protein n=1 Tax=Dorcoceras hygrometricum TaxID=472368 RepID=A0A2Z7CVH5_9LAMI|nr:hypothetical protein F511_10335 [Dorcoceras hygrometricum]
MGLLEEGGDGSKEEEWRLGFLGVTAHEEEQPAPEAEVTAGNEQMAQEQIAEIDRIVQTMEETEAVNYEEHQAQEEEHRAQEEEHQAPEHQAQEEERLDPEYETEQPA